MAGILDVAAYRLRDWDSTFFGASIAQVAASRLAPARLARIVADADAAGIDCLYFLADATDPETVRAAEQSGFSLVDVRLTLACGLAPDGQDAGAAGSRDRGAAGESQQSVAADSDPAAGDRARIRVASPADRPALTALARTSHRNTRFYRDLRFDRDRCDDLYATWIERSVAGELADVVWVVDVDGAALGYLTLTTEPRGAVDGSSGGRSSTIGLVAVDPACRGRGYGDALLREACAWTRRRGIPRAVVVTQGNNAGAARFYQRAGFVTSRVELWYHRWR